MRDDKHPYHKLEQGAYMDQEAVLGFYATIDASFRNNAPLTQKASAW